MRLPVATIDPSDEGFSWTTEGELVMVAFTCERDRRAADQGCGCGRAFAGLDSHRATTRAVVREVDIELTALNRIVRESLAQGGWIPAAGALNQHDAEFLAEVTAEMVEIGETFPEGATIVRRLDDVFSTA